MYSTRQFVNPYRLIFEKYPGRCPYCDYAECHCPEIKQGKMERNLNPPIRELIPVKVFPEMAQRLLKRIYARANAQYSIEKLWERVEEEIGELQDWISTWEESGGFTTEQTRGYKFELADVFARLYAVMSRFDFDIGDALSSTRGGPPYLGTPSPRIQPATPYIPIPNIDQE